MRLITGALFVTALLVPTALPAQSNIDSTLKHSWQENLGWGNWRGDGTSSGAFVGSSFLSGFVWLENAGWVNLGDGSPLDGIHYGNLDGADFGVNLSATGGLSGFAWGENIGWLNFDTSSLGAARARIDDCSRFRGFVWGENIGWINLDDSTRYVALDPFQPAPSGTPSLSASYSGGVTLLSWTGLAGATGYDMVRGSLTILAGTSGDFTSATTTCLGDNIRGGLSLNDGDIPGVGQGFWYVTRGVTCGGNGTYDSLGTSQTGLRDAEINAAATSCP